MILKRKKERKKASVFMKLVFHSLSYFEQCHFYRWFVETLIVISSKWWPWFSVELMLFFLFSSKRISCSDLKVLVSCQVGNWSLGPHTSGYLVIISSCRLGLCLKSLLLQWKHLIMGLWPGNPKCYMLYLNLELNHIFT